MAPMPPTPDPSRAPEGAELFATKWFDGYELVGSPVSVRIAGGRITNVAEVSVPPPGAIEIGREAILCPGFIDTHSHSDFSIQADPRAVSAILQGITTQVIGQCGFSAAPQSSQFATERAVADDPTSLPGLDPPSWRDFAGYREQLAAARPAVNVVPLVGHNTLIRAVDDAAPVAVARHAAKALAEGARGVSTGLSYQLGRRSNDEGVIRLAETAQRHEALYHTHMRYSAEETVETLTNTLRLLAGRHSRPTISHVFPRLRDQSTTAGSLLAVIDRFASEFDALTFDVTVYESGGTPWTQGLPDWAIASDFAPLATLVADRDWRERVVRYLRLEAEGWVTDWPNLVVTKLATTERRSALGRTIGELAGSAGMDPAEYAVDLLSTEGHFWVSPPNKLWSDVLELLMDDRCIPMVDGITVDPRNPNCLVSLDRSWNAFRRFLLRVVGEGALPLPLGLRKLTGDAADRLGLTGRGVIRPGAAADFTVLNPDNIAELTGPDFDLVGRGIDGVMVNGSWVIDLNQRLTTARPGSVL